MPVITIDMLEGKSAEQKQQLVEKMTQDFCEITGVASNVVTIIFHDIPRESWGSGGKLKSEVMPK